jgi:hypothetical protein
VASLRLLIATLVAVCAGCAALDPQAATLRATDRVVAEALNASRAPASEQRTALARARSDFERNPEPAARLRLAALLALLPAPLGDESRAAALLAPIADVGAAGIGRLAALLAAQLAEKQRLAHEADQLARENERIARERERQDRERDKREEALRQQVEALRAIERNIREREEKLRRGQR